MTLEQIVATHPCPIIRGKIMRSVSKKISYDNLDEVINIGFLWVNQPEGRDFWLNVYGNLTATYSDLKHLDKSYVPEPAKPPVMWRKIDVNNLCIEVVAAMHIEQPNLVFTGKLYTDDDYNISLEISKGATIHFFTHYIPLSDLINLPIED